VFKKDLAFLEILHQNKLLVDETKYVGTDCLGENHHLVLNLNSK